MLQGAPSLQQLASVEGQIKKAESPALNIAQSFVSAARLDVGFAALLPVEIRHTCCHMKVASSRSDIQSFQESIFWHPSFTTREMCRV